MTPGDQDRVSDAACTLRQTLELGIQHTTLLRAKDTGAHCIAAEAVCNGVGGPFETKVEGATVWQLTGGAARSVVDVVRLDPNAAQSRNYFAAVDLARVGSLKGRLDDAAGVRVHLGS